MGVASRIAKAVTKKAEPEATMVRKSAAELNELRDKYSGDSRTGMAARNEISRRNELADYKKENPDWKEKGIPEDIGPNWYKSRNSDDVSASGRMKIPNTSKQEKAADKDAYAFAMGKEPIKRKEAKNLSASEKKDLEESLKFKKGGLVKKKPGAAKAKAPAAKSKAPVKAKTKSTFSIKNNNYGK